MGLEAAGAGGLAAFEAASAPWQARISIPVNSAVQKDLFDPIVMDWSPSRRRPPRSAGGMIVVLTRPSKINSWPLFRAVARSPVMVVPSPTWTSTGSSL